MIGWIIIFYNKNDNKYGGIHINYYIFHKIRIPAKKKKMIISSSLGKLKFCSKVELNP